MKRIFHNQRGDTIVEVLVSVAALSLVLSASYALANRSSQATRQAQERGESFKLAESQLERFKEYLTVPSSDNPEPADGDVFCVIPKPVVIPSDNGKIILDKFVAPALPPANAQDELTAQFSAFGAHPGCVSGFYNTFIERTGNTYTVHTRWNAVTGRGIDEATMVYRVYPDSEARLLGGSLMGAGCPAGQVRNPVGQCVSGPSPDIIGASPIPYNSPATITWSTDNNLPPATCSGTFPGSNSPSGSYTSPNLTADVTYSISCYNVNGTGSDLITIDVADSSWSANGANYGSCQDSSNLYMCRTQGGSVYALQGGTYGNSNFKITYPTIVAGSGLASGNYTLNLNYANFDYQNLGTPLPPGYSYNINIYVNGVLVKANQSLPASPSGNQVFTTTLSGLTGPITNIAVEWTNDYFTESGGTLTSDANFKLNSLTLYRL